MLPAGDIPAISREAAALLALARVLATIVELAAFEFATCTTAAGRGTAGGATGAGAEKSK